MLGDRYVGMGQACGEKIVQGARPKVQEVSRNPRSRPSRARRWIGLHSLERVRRGRKLCVKSYASKW